MKENIYIVWKQLFEFLLKSVLNFGTKDRTGDVLNFSSRNYLQVNEKQELTSVLEEIYIEEKLGSKEFALKFLNFLLGMPSGSRQDD